MDKQKKNDFIRPFLKWAGGKRQLLDVILTYAPNDFGTYYEPFVGGGAVLFGMEPRQAVINDKSWALINCYRVLKDERLARQLMNDLKAHVNEEEYYYKIRAMDREEGFKELSRPKKASRTIFLNKTCFNGLFRVNSQGQFNVPFGRYSNPKILDKEVLVAVGNYLRENAVVIRCSDFSRAVRDAKKDDFVYFDPPYHPVSDTASFTGYDIGGFTTADQRRLKRVFDNLTTRGCKCMLSNSDTPFIRNLYKEYEKTTISVTASRAINANANGRGKVGEVLVMNYEQPAN